MMADDKDDFFSDDDLLDAIPTNTLDALEHQAVVTSTQKSQVTRASVPVLGQGLRRQAHNATSLNRAGSNTNRPWRPPSSTRPQSVQPQQRPAAPPPSAPAPPSSDYGYDDEDVIDLDEPSLIIQPAPHELTRRDGYQGLPRRYSAKTSIDPETEAAFAAADTELGDDGVENWQQQNPQPPQGVQANTFDFSTLQARIAQLEAEQARLRESEARAREEVLAKQGEIAIIRSNQEKSAKTYESRIAVMQRLHNEERAKQKLELDAQRKEREKIETDNRFLQHDLAQEAERAKKQNDHGKVRAGPSLQNETPRRSKRTARGDGFDDNEIQMISPSKSKERVKDQTPKLGAKRKRPVNDSPTAALSFYQPPEAQILRHESTDQSFTSLGQPANKHAVVRDDSKYKYMQLILSRSPYEGHKRTLEALGEYALPLKTGKKLSSIFLDQITSAGGPQDGNLPLLVARAALCLWSDCLREQYFSPLYLILDLLFFSLRNESPLVKAQLSEDAVPLCVESINLVASTIVRASTNKVFAAKLEKDRESFQRLEDELDPDAVLDLLFAICEASSLSPERKEVFWRTIDLHWMLLLLNKAQPLNQILTTLRMLGHSVRDTTFGVIAFEPEKQADQEKALIDQLTNMLFEKPEAPKDEPAYSDEELLEIRLEVLKVFKELSYTDHGSLKLTQHRSAMGRLVRFLDAQVAKLYRVRPSLGRPTTASAGQATTHDLIVKTVNRATRLVYHIILTFEDPSLIVKKMNAVHGGYHKFLVSLTRIAFSEQLVFEHGIDDETAEAAHNILDNILGPEDGEAVMKAIETPRGTRGSIATPRNLEPADQESQQDETMVDDEPG